MWSGRGAESGEEIKVVFYKYSEWVKSAGDFPPLPWKKSKISFFLKGFSEMGHNGSNPVLLHEQAVRNSHDTSQNFNSTNSSEIHTGWHAIMVQKQNTQHFVPLHLELASNCMNQIRIHSILIFMIYISIMNGYNVKGEPWQNGWSCRHVALKSRLRVVEPTSCKVRLPTIDPYSRYDPLLDPHIARAL